MLSGIVGARLAGGGAGGGRVDGGEGADRPHVGRLALIRVNFGHESGEIEDSAIGGAHTALAAGCRGRGGGRNGGGGRGWRGRRRGRGGERGRRWLCRQRAADVGGVGVEDVHPRPVVDLRDGSGGLDAWAAGGVRVARNVHNSFDGAVVGAKVPLAAKGHRLRRIRDVRQRVPAAELGLLVLLVIFVLRNKSLSAAARRACGRRVDRLGERHGEGIRSIVKVGVVLSVPVGGDEGHD